MPAVVMVKTLANLAGVDSRLDLPGSTVNEVLTHLCSHHHSLTDHLLYSNGKLKGHVLLSVGDERVGLDHPIRDEDELRILLATAGGCR
ncbi:hypothetical protein ACFY00_24450 [Kitasatospora sp. NPDC001540]|uniref:hypothetical protein n=1 Tax=Kitasatospora sp. NPDC001540 TaxID=3364014 RepID=UPI00368C5CFB